MQEPKMVKGAVRRKSKERVAWLEFSLEKGNDAAAWMQ